MISYSNDTIIRFLNDFKLESRADTVNKIRPFISVFAVSLNAALE